MGGAETTRIGELSGRAPREEPATVTEVTAVTRRFPPYPVTAA